MPIHDRLLSRTQLGSLTIFFAFTVGLIRPVASFADEVIKPAPLPLISPGVTIDSDRRVSDGSQLVLLAIPRVAAGDVESAPETIRKYASMFGMAITAKIERTDSGYRMAELAVGNCVQQGQQWVVISSKDYEKHGVTLDFFARQVLSRSEDNLRKARIVGRSDGFRLFDAEAVVRHQGDHVAMKLRHIVWVNRQSGKLATMMWALRPTKSGLTMIEDVVHALPARFVEDRVFSVKADEITLGIPSAKAIAMYRLPRGREIRISPELKQLASAESFTESRQRQLVAGLNEAIRRARQASVSHGK